jgi:hypothetical protein
MPLSSRLFKKNAALEACLVQNTAHILWGALGDHVGKIQIALDFLDRAQIDQEELRTQKYGPSTARAVLAYKQKRKIINTSYQTQADDIVGKMTVAALDREMLVLESRSQRQPGCGDPARASGAGVGAVVPVSLGVRSAGLSSRSSTPIGAPAPTPKFPANLSLLWHVTAEAAKRGANRHLAYVPAAVGLLEASGIDSVVTVPPDLLPSHDIVDTRFKTDTFGVRKISEARTPGQPGVLRVIVCPFDAGSEAFGVTDGGVLDSQTFRLFVLINVNKLRADNCTLLHEMIHAATGLGEEDHDRDTNSVFSTASNRFVLKPQHAEALSKSFFATKK